MQLICATLSLANHLVTLQAGEGRTEIAPQVPRGRLCHSGDLKSGDQKQAKLWHQSLIQAYVSPVLGVCLVCRPTVPVFSTFTSLK